MLLHGRHTAADTFIPWVDVILWSTLLILQKGADVSAPAWLPWGPPTLLEQMCSAIVNRHVCLSPSYYSRRMINRLITQKHQCKATEQWGISSNIYLNIAQLQGPLTKWRERGRRRKKKLMKMPPHESPSPTQYAQTHTLPAAGAIIFLFQFDTQAFSC